MDSRLNPVFWTLRIAFGLTAFLAGLDKFLNLLTNWEQYASPLVLSIVPLSAGTLMRAAGVIEIIAGIVVAIHPRLGGPVVAAWLVGIIVNLLLISGFYDVALRDFGLFLAAVALSRLATKYDPRPLLWVSSGR